MHICSPPFQTSILDDSCEKPTEFYPADNVKYLTDLLPATFRVHDDIKNPKLDISRFLENELSIDALDDIKASLWLAGRPAPPRALHHQLLLSRQIVVTESLELHLIWSRERMFLKPLPPFLLDTSFWQKYMLCGGDSPRPSQSSTTSSTCSDENCQKKQKLLASAQGFLFSYTALISHRSDFGIARDNGLLPGPVTWEKWKTFTEQFLESCSDYSSYSPRFWYGELRLGRLNKIYRLQKLKMLRGYTRVAAPSFYADFLAENFAVLTGVLGYVVIVLTAMQVGLATDRLQPDSAFQSASYGLTVFSIIAPLIAVAVLFAVLLVMLVSNWQNAKRYEKERFAHIGVDPPWQRRASRREIGHDKGTD